MDTHIYSKLNGQLWASIKNEWVSHSKCSVCMESAQMVSHKHSQQQFYGSGYYFSIFLCLGSVPVSINIYYNFVMGQKIE